MSSPKPARADHARLSPSPSEIPEAHPHSRGDTLRQRAEKTHAFRKTGTPDPADPLDARRLLQELEIHQIELEIQNLELRRARETAEKALELYRDLYDFAPAGYFTLSPGGNILMVNLAGAVLLGAGRDALTGQAFSDWIAPGMRPGFAEFLSRVLSGKDLLSTELEIIQAGGKPFRADIGARTEIGGGGCRLIVTDVTHRNAERKKQRRLTSSALSNRKLQEEARHWRHMDLSLDTVRLELELCLGQPGKGKKEDLLNLSLALLGAQEEERKRISEELRNRIAQSLEMIQGEFDLLARSGRPRPARPLPRSSSSPPHDAGEDV